MSSERKRRGLLLQERRERERERESSPLPTALAKERERERERENKREGECLLPRLLGLGEKLFLELTERALAELTKSTRDAHEAHPRSIQ